MKYSIEMKGIILLFINPWPYSRTAVNFLRNPNFSKIMKKEEGSGCKSKAFVNENVKNKVKVL